MINLKGLNVNDCVIYDGFMGRLNVWKGFPAAFSLAVAKLALGSRTISIVKVP